MIRVVHPGSRIQDPHPDFLPIPGPVTGSRIQRSKRHRIPDPDPQHLGTARVSVRSAGAEAAWAAAVRQLRSGGAARTPARTGPPGRTGLSAAGPAAAAQGRRSGSVCCPPPAPAACNAPGTRRYRRSATRRSARLGQSGLTGLR
jgi:hypothetical protein